MHKEEKKYRLNFLIEPFPAIEGTAADVAREYCIIEGIKLFVSQWEDGHMWLFTDFSDIEPDTISRVAKFENDDVIIDFEAGYELFFKKYLNSDNKLDNEPKQWQIIELQ